MATLLTELPIYALQMIHVPINEWLLSLLCMQLYMDVCVICPHAYVRANACVGSCALVFINQAPVKVEYHLKTCTIITVVSIISSCVAICLPNSTAKDLHNTNLTVGASFFLQIAVQ